MNLVLAVLFLALGSWWASAPLRAARPATTAPARGRRRERRTGGAPDRTALALSLLTALVGVVIARFAVPWGAAPPVLWALPVALAAAGAIVAARRWSALPALESPRPGWRLAGVGVEVAVTTVLLAVIIGV